MSVRSLAFSAARPLVGLAAFALLGTGRADAQRARQGMLSLDDARLYYEVIGTGAPIFVVHGGPGLDHRYLQPGLNVLARSNTLVYYDQRGVGRSSAELVPSAINMRAFVEDIEALRDALGYERIDVLGHSFGALIALEYAAAHPDRLRTLILMNPADPGARFQDELEERRLARRTEQDAAALAELRSREGFAARDPATVSEVYRILFRESMKDRERVVDLDLDLAEATAKNGADVERLLRESLGEEPDLWDRLNGIQTPTLVLHGRYDPTPLGMSQELARSLPLGRLVVLESGHFPFVEDPDGLVSAISAFYVDVSR